MSKPAGRPPVTISVEEVEKLASLNCTDDEISAYFGIARETFVRRKARNVKIREAVQRGREKGKLSLRRAQFQAALNGNTSLMIWLGKQILGQRDNLELTGNNAGPIATIQTLDDLVAEAEESASGEDRP